MKAGRRRGRPAFDFKMTAAGRLNVLDTLTSRKVTDLAGNMSGGFGTLCKVIREPVQKLTFRPSLVKRAISQFCIWKHANFFNSRTDFRAQKPMCHLSLGNLMDVQERHITNRKCRDSGVQAIRCCVPQVAHPARVCYTRLVQSWPPLLPGGHNFEISGLILPQSRNKILPPTENLKNKIHPPIESPKTKFIRRRRSRNKILPPTESLKTALALAAVCIIYSRFKVTQITSKNRERILSSLTTCVIWQITRSSRNWSRSVLGKKPGYGTVERLRVGLLSEFSSVVSSVVPSPFFVTLVFSDFTDFEQNCTDKSSAVFGFANSGIAVELICKRMTNSRFRLARIVLLQKTFTTYFTFCSDKVNLKILTDKFSHKNWIKTNHEALRWLLRTERTHAPRKFLGTFFDDMPDDLVANKRTARGPDYARHVLGSHRRHKDAINQVGLCSPRCLPNQLTRSGKNRTHSCRRYFKDAGSISGFLNQCWLNQSVHVLLRTFHIGYNIDQSDDYCL
ncbi:hypothetical protein J6590_024190 [Homalodisca vitripennis]|nr:hypothetical protein J6590_024190 [Homalodisca vitripennis]